MAVTQKVTRQGVTGWTTSCHAVLGSNGTDSNTYALVEMKREINKSILRAEEWRAIIQSGNRIEGKIPNTD